MSSQRHALCRGAQASRPGPSVVALRRARHPLCAVFDGSRGPLGPGHEAAERMRQAGLEAAAADAIVKASDDGITLGVAGPLRELTAAVDRLAQDMKDRTDRLAQDMKDRTDRLAQDMKDRTDRLEKKTDQLDKDVTGLRSSGVVAVAVLLLVLLGITSPDVWQNGPYGQLLMKVLPGAK